MIVRVAQMVKDLPAIFRLLLGLVLSPLVLPLVVVAVVLFAVCEIIVVVLTIPMLPLYIGKTGRECRDMKSINPFFILNEDIFKFDLGSF